MRIAVLSGKGGTGKTFVSVNLSYVNPKSLYVDCDVEEPNGKLFFKPQLVQTEKVNVMVPTLVNEKCSGCRKCIDLCQFNALAYIIDKVYVFPELCHACKGCVLICPAKALIESEKNIGYIEHGISKNVEVRTGILNIGEATGVPIIRKMLDNLPQDKTVVIDCPPGSACTVMESIKDADYCVMVAEPTLFGIHNLDMVYRLIKLFKKPHGLVVNKGMGENILLENYCKDKGIEILEIIPYDQEMGLANSKGLIASQEYTWYKNLFSRLWDKIGMGVLK